MSGTATAQHVSLSRRVSNTAAEALAAYALTTPATILLFILLLLPAVAVFIIAVTDWQFGARSFSFVGFENFRQMLEDEVFRHSIRNTLVYVGMVVPFSVFLGLGVAMLIESRSSLRVLYRTVYFIPVMATLAAMAMAWEVVLHPDIGLFNQLLRIAGIEGRSWLREENTALATLAVIAIWQNVGYNMVLYLAGLRGIPQDLYEAAAVDGADSAWNRFRLVTWPLLSPATMFVVVITAIRSFRVFDTVRVLTLGGPQYKTEVLLWTVYKEGFSFFRAGYASALTVVFLFIIVSLTLLQVRVIEKRVHYT